MITKELLNNTLRVIFPAGFEEINQVCLEANRFLGVHNPHMDTFEVELGMRELLTNAVRHGCNLDPGKKVLFSMLIENNTLIIEVEDGGKGFDWKSVLAMESNDCIEGGRGIGILHCYFDTIRFNSTGNKVTCHKKLNQ